MSQPLNLPEKYYIVWLDQHIGNPEFYLHLKRAFFTHVDPESGDVVSLSDKDITRSIQAHSEIAVNFDNFRFTFRAFEEETPCLEYIEKNKDHRILFITSSTLGESAVRQLLRSKPHPFINSKTDEPYDSIYVFCTDIMRASEWAGDYLEYVKIFDFEADLLTRMTRDLGEEFLKHGQKLMENDRYELALERLSWAKSLFIRYENLKCSNEPEIKTTAEQGKVRHPPAIQLKKPQTSEKLREIDRLLDIVDEQMKKQSEDNSDQDDFQMQTISTEIFPPMADHHIIWLHELVSSDVQMETDDQYATGVCDSASVEIADPITHDYVQYEREIEACLKDMPGDLEICHDMNRYRQSIIESGSTKRIFLVTSGSTAKKILTDSTEIHGSIKKIYVLGDYTSEVVDRIGYYRNEGIDILIFDLHNNLLIRLLQDMSKYYLSKGEYSKNSAFSSAKPALIYFDWAKKMITRANQLAEKEFKNQLSSIDKYKSETEMFIRQTNFTQDVEQQLQICQDNEDCDSVAVIFIVGLEVKLIHLASGIAQLLTCTTNDQIISAINSVKLPSPIIVVSTTLPSDNLLSINQLLNYYCFLKSERSLHIPKENHSNVTYVSSIDQLMNELYHKLAQHYRDKAIQASVEYRDKDKAKRLLDRSTKCYELLKTDNEKILKRYAELLKKT